MNTELSTVLDCKQAALMGGSYLEALPGGGIVQAEDQNVKYLFSRGFMCCSGLIMFNRQTNSAGLAHVEPIDELPKALRGYTYRPDEDEALMVYGDRSERSFEIEHILASKGVKFNIARLQTAKKAFGLILDLKNFVILVTGDSESAGSSFSL